jgi:hypothetical protein
VVNRRIVNSNPDQQRQPQSTSSFPHFHETIELRATLSEINITRTQTDDGLDSMSETSNRIDCRITDEVQHSVAEPLLMRSLFINLTTKSITCERCNDKHYPLTAKEFDSLICNEEPDSVKESTICAVRVVAMFTLVLSLLAKLPSLQSLDVQFDSTLWFKTLTSAHRKKMSDVIADLEHLEHFATNVWLDHYSKNSKSLHLTLRSTADLENHGPFLFPTWEPILSLSELERLELDPLPWVVHDFDDDYDEQSLPRQEPSICCIKLKTLVINDYHQHVETLGIVSRILRACPHLQKFKW